MGKMEKEKIGSKTEQNALKSPLFGFKPPTASKHTGEKWNSQGGGGGIMTEIHNINPYL